MNHRSDITDSNMSRLLVVILLLGVWQALTQLFSIPHFLLPSPVAVTHTLWERGGFLAYHGAITSLEMVIGLLLGCLLGIATAMAMVLLGQAIGEKAQEKGENCQDDQRRKGLISLHPGVGMQHDEPQTLR